MRSVLRVKSGRKSSFYVGYILKVVIMGSVSVRRISMLSSVMVRVESGMMRCGK